MLSALLNETLPLFKHASSDIDRKKFVNDGKSSTLPWNIPTGLYFIDGFPFWPSCLLHSQNLSKSTVVCKMKKMKKKLKL